MVTGRRTTQGPDTVALHCGAVLLSLLCSGLLEPSLQVASARTAVQSTNVRSAVLCAVRLCWRQRQCFLHRSDLTSPPTPPVYSNSPCRFR